MAVKNATTPIEVDQVWRDDQQGQQGRTIKITGVGVVSVDIETLTPTDNAFNPQAAIGRKGKTAITNLRRNFTLLRTPSLKDSQSHAAAADALAEGLSAGRTLGALQDQLGAQGGGITLFCRAGQWTCAIEFGREVPDSPMVGGAAYGSGDSLTEALHEALGQTGWMEKVE